MSNLFLHGTAFNKPKWLAKKLSRRQLLKSAAGASAIASLSPFSFAITNQTQHAFQQALTELKWQTLDAVLMHLLPESDSGPGAKSINATFYLYQLVHQQPTEQEEIDFVYQGVGWLNGYTNSKLQKNFIELEDEAKEEMLREISTSSAGKSWLNMLIIDIYEAMLSPPAYGGNPNGIGWQWLDHQAGFPLPNAGQRYFELPPRAKVAQKKALLSVVVLGSAF